MAAIEAVADHYQLANYFDRRMFDSEDPSRCICVGTMEVRFTAVRGDLATEVIAYVDLDTPVEDMATVTIQDCEVLVRREHRGDFRPEDFGINRTSGNRRPDICISVPIPSEDEVPRHPPRRRPESPSDGIFRPRVIGQLGESI